jgi:hypothetical protein
MKEGLLRDIAISLGFMAIFFGASSLHGVLSEKPSEQKTCVCTLEEDPGNGRNPPECLAPDR